MFCHSLCSACCLPTTVDARVYSPPVCYHLHVITVTWNSGDVLFVSYLQFVGWSQTMLCFYTNAGGAQLLTDACLESIGCHTSCPLVCRYSQSYIAYHNTTCLQIQLQCVAIAELITLCCWVCLAICLYRLEHAIADRRSALPTAIKKPKSLAAAGNW